MVNEEEQIMLKEINEHQEKYFEIFNGSGEYLQNHVIIDDFVWMLKLNYSDKDTIKRKKYRKDILFQEYIRENKISIKKIKNTLISDNGDKSKFIYYLKQGWYNELASEYPFSADCMNIGTSIEEDENQWKIDLFPSWYIVKNYYTVYSYYTSLVFTKNKNIRTNEHRKPTQYFNSSLIKPYSKAVLFYPFCISYPQIEKIEKIRKESRDLWKYNYALCPRSIGNTKKKFNSIQEYIDSISSKKEKNDFFNIEREYLNGLDELYKKLGQKAAINIVDVLYNFRVWANYVGSDTILELKGGGYTRFLERNLSTISFFLAGICELVAIAYLGEEEYSKLFYDFYNNFIKERNLIYNDWYRIPLINRNRIYEKMGFLTNKEYRLYPPNSDQLELL